MTTDPLPMEIDVQSVKTLLDEQADFLLLDCRESTEYETAHIEGAMRLPMSELMKRADELKPHQSRRVVVHCHHGGRSLQVAQWLLQQGFAQVQSMQGGIDVWSQEIDGTVPRY